MTINIQIDINFTSVFIYPPEIVRKWIGRGRAKGKYFTGGLLSRRWFLSFLSIEVARSGIMPCLCNFSGNDQVSGLFIVQVERTGVEFQPDLFIHLDMADT
jgi:hypothetical protein